MRETGFGRHWRAVDANPDEVESDHEEHIPLPGDEDFEDERPWMNQGEETVGLEGARNLNRAAGLEKTYTYDQIDSGDTGEDDDEEENIEPRPACVSTGGKSVSGDDSSSSDDSDSDSDRSSDEEEEEEEVARARWSKKKKQRTN